MTKSLAARPATRPSVLNSSAGEATAFAKPVMGTSAPAPAKAANLSYTPRPVSSAPRKMSATLVQTPASSPAPAASRPSVISSPSVQTAPPHRKARSVSGPVTDFGERRLTSSAYCSFVSLRMVSPRFRLPNAAGLMRGNIFSDISGSCVIEYS